MDRGPVSTSKNTLEYDDLSLVDMDYIELNESFTTQSLVVIKEMKLQDRMDIINVKGGTIALGHPLECTLPALRFNKVCCPSFP